MKNTMKKSILVIIALFFCLMFSSCGSETQSEDNPLAGAQRTEQIPAAVQSETETNAQPVEQHYDSGPLLLSEYNADETMEISGGNIDLSSLSEGYFGVSAVSEMRLKIKVTKEGEPYVYDVPNDGTPVICPLTQGAGNYELALYEQVEGSKYHPLWKDTISVELNDEFAPFLRPSVMVNYSEESDAVQFARDFSASSKDELELASTIYDWLVKNVTYDYDKAKTVKKGYLPDPDDTLRTKTGICMDYAALVAAALRSQNIPCQVITGYVGEDALYHAWNRIYFEEQGWLTFEIKVSDSDWKRIDVTFAASGTDIDAIENDQLYTTRFVY